MAKRSGAGDVAPRYRRLDAEEPPEVPEPEPPAREPSEPPQLPPKPPPPPPGSSRDRREARVRRFLEGREAGAARRSGTPDPEEPGDGNAATTPAPRER